MSRTLVLDQGYLPHRIVGWKRAVTMLFEGKVEVIEEYEEDIRSISISIKMPAVVRLLGAIRGRKKAIKFSRINVMTRDKYRCQYCGEKLSMNKLNYDHVVPRSRGGRTVWENIVTACYPCNEKKGDRTPAEAGMRLLKKPVKPTYLPMIAFRIDTSNIPDAWASWIYWQSELKGD